MDLIKYMRENISAYSVDLPIDKENKPFKQSYYKEVIPEVLSKDNTNGNDFTKEFVRILKGMIL